MVGGGREGRRRRGARVHGLQPEPTLERRTWETPARLGGDYCGLGRLAVILWGSPTGRTRFGRRDGNLHGWRWPRGAEEAGAVGFGSRRQAVESAG